MTKTATEIFGQTHNIDAVVARLTHEARQGKAQGARGEIAACRAMRGLREVLGTEDWKAYIKKTFGYSVQTGKLMCDKADICDALGISDFLGDGEVLSLMMRMGSTHPVTAEIIQRQAAGEFMSLERARNMRRGWESQHKTDTSGPEVQPAEPLPDHSVEVFLEAVLRQYAKLGRKTIEELRPDLDRQVRRGLPEVIKFLQATLTNLSEESQA
jgi:hypothetical protein